MKKRFLALMLVITCFMAMNVTAFAATSDDSAEQPETIAAIEGAEASVRSIYGYAADYTDYNAASFTVSAPGSATSTGHATIKSSDFSSSSVIIYVTIYRPDGSRAITNAKLTGNQEKVVSFSDAQPGTYTVSYAITGTVKGWMHCWIY